ncbi:MAG: RdgB/HAM1 family non-canonical purine NTP pyrophosphatase [Chloroflexi bacterium]|nr:RdgB/HAM1 family non-canonical purine NTP pyrophosphatase [Chloroflexota bacterium]
MNSLLLASENPGKLSEILDLLADLPVEVVTPQTLGLRLQVVEDGQTYADNARRKALAFAHAGKMVALGDDSGLEVEALGGRPGIYSARFAPWEGATDADRRRYLLQQLQGRPQPEGVGGWPARFHCTVAVAAPSGEIRFAEGECPGVIISEERGTNGFGYDPVFYLPEYGQTMAELGMEVKNRISHRARAVQAAKPILIEMLGLD